MRQDTNVKIDDNKSKTDEYKFTGVKFNINDIDMKVKKSNAGRKPVSNDGKKPLWKAGKKPNINKLTSRSAAFQNISNW